MSSAADFDDVAALYAVARPSYPQDAVDWLVGPDALIVVDVGAGTGLFTRLLSHPGRTVIAVEPSAAMRNELSAALPTVEALQGSGERIPLPDASADAVVFAQAWHWVDTHAASREAGRVLRPGGRLGLVWNLRDERVAWVQELGVAMRADGDHFRGAPQDPDVSSPFGAPERSLVEWVRVCTPDDIVDDVRSRSYFALLSAAAQHEVVGDVRRVLDGHPETAGRASIALPYVTASFRYDRP